MEPEPLLCACLFTTAIFLPDPKYRGHGRDSVYILQTPPPPPPGDPQSCLKCSWPAWSDMS